MSRKIRAKAEITDNIPAESCQCDCQSCALEIKNLKAEIKNLKAEIEKLQTPSLRCSTRLSANTTNNVLQETSAKKHKDTKPCSCKKNCNKKCGCIKKGSKCGDKCKCDKSICTNKENEPGIASKSVPVIQIEAAADSGPKKPVTLEDNENFHPMRPRHELPRSPVQINYSTSNSGNETSSNSLQCPTPLHDLSNINLSLRNVSLRKYSNVPSIPEVVDWEEHQACLKECHKCYRKFLPERLKKHIPNCKKI